MTTTPQSLLASLPPSLDSEFVMAFADEPTLLAAGSFELIHQGKVLGHLKGELTLEWLPKLSIRCRGESDVALPDLWNCPHLGLHVSQLDLSAEVLVTKVELGTTSEVCAAVNAAENPRVSESDRFLFYLVNFPQCAGELIRTESGPRSSASRDRRRITGPGGLTCTIDRISEAGHSERRQGRPGYLITHVAEVRRTCQPISPGEMADLLETLYWFFAFVRGARTGPILPSVDSPFVDHWIGIGPWKVDEPRQAKSWLPERTFVSLDSLFSGFIEKWTDPGWREGLKTTVAWYVAANAPSAPHEASIPLCQIALEVLASLRGSSKGKAPSRIRELLRELRIPVRVPSRLVELAQFAERESYDAPACLVRIRNILEHPNKAVNRSLLREMGGMVRYQAAQYGLELVELVVLAIFNYRDAYSQRAHQGWKGAEEVPVPWS